MADGADVVVLGEGEPVILELVTGLAEGRDLGSLPGLLFRAPNGEVVRTAGHSQTTTLDDLPIVDRSLYNLPEAHPSPTLASRMVARTIAHFAVITRAPYDGVAICQHERVIAEMEHLRVTPMARARFFLPTTFSFFANTTSWSSCKAYATAKSVSNGLAKCARDRVGCTRVAEGCELAECQRIYFGVESGLDRILRDAQKGMTTDQIRRGIRAAFDAGLVKTGWIYGLPACWKIKDESIPFMLDLRRMRFPSISSFPFPGTIYYTDLPVSAFVSPIQRLLKAFVMAVLMATFNLII